MSKFFLLNGSKKIDGYIREKVEGLSKVFNMFTAKQISLICIIWIIIIAAKIKFLLVG
jgi:hypothetical protein